MPLLLSIFAYAFVGVFAGFASGLLGIGGGVVTVPCLYFLFKVSGYPQADLMFMAIATSLASMTLSSFSSMQAHKRHGNILWNIIKGMLPGVILGALLGVILTFYLPTVLLEVLFGVFLILLSLSFFKKKKPHFEPQKVPKWPILSLWMTGIGTLSNLFGIGGGTFTVPLLSSFRCSTKNAIGTSSAISFFLTTLGALFYLFVNRDRSGIPYTFGGIQGIAFICVGIAGFVSARYGARLVSKLSEELLRKIFGILLVVLGLSMIY